MINKLFSSILLTFILCLPGHSQSIALSEWKFITGDKLEYAKPAFNDHDWTDISPLELWENQGFEDYDGYAWYRVKVVVPASMKRIAKKYDGLMLRLGKVDDADVTYFNGHIAGSTGKLPPHYVSAYDTRRSYLIPTEYVQWDEENTIAVRVYDPGGYGGLYEGPAEITGRGKPDMIGLEPSLPETDMIINGSPDISIPVTFTSDFKKKYKGVLTLKIVSDMGNPIITEHQDIVVKRKSTEVFTFVVKNLNPGFYSATVSVSGSMGNKEHIFNFGYEPEKIVSPADPQPDFKKFWKETKAELAAVDPQYRMIKIDSLCTEKHNVYLVEMRSLGNVLIRGWYQAPVRPGKYPAIMQVPGYSSVMVPSYINYGDDIIGFGLNIRGHGNSIDDVNPGFPGYILTNLEDKEKYIYRGAYMDCIRGVDFLWSRPEVDRSRIAVEGASQGGALTYVTAALDNERIAVCAPQVPFLSDFRDYFRVATWPADEFIEYVEKEKKQTWDEVYKTLSYFDIKNLAPMIKAPLIMGVGLMDDVCPPHINFAAYNNVTAEKKYIAYPESGHGLPGAFYNEKMDWILTKFGQEKQFISVDDGMFVLDNEPYFFVGANYWYGGILGSEGEYGDRERLIRELDHLQSIGVTNLRILVGAEGPDGEPTRVTPTLQVAPGEYSEDLLDGLDFLMSEMKKRGQYAILYLNNSWEWSGGYSQYLSWNGYGPIPYPSLPGNTWPGFMEYASQFHNCETCIEQYHEFIRFILGRTNKYTGLKYTEDPVIMTWEIGNEPRAFKKEILPAFEKMIAGTAAFIKELDGNHLVTTGTEGLHGCEYSWDAFKKIHSDPNIDYLTMHIWPKNWAWLDVTDIGGSMDKSIRNTNEYMRQHIEVAREMNKPIVLEEFGLPRDHHGFDPTESVNFRDRYFRNAFKQILEHALKKDVLAGCNFWAYSGEGRSGGESIYWEPGDDYLGDPPQEEQGLNSVFDTDPTIDIIAEYNKLISNRTGRQETEETENLRAALTSLSGEGIMFGHQDDLAYGVDWKYPGGESDVKRVCGDYPAVYGMDLGHLENGSDYNLDSVAFDHMKIFTGEIYNRGGIITFSWHADNPQTGGDAWDVSSKTTVASILPGGANNEKFTQWLDHLAEFFLSLTGEDGEAIPIIFRPYHEHTGSWFWWGENLCSADEFIELWHFTVDYLCNESNVHNLLFSYSPSSNFNSEKEYLERYPGDRYVDLLGFDYYQASPAFGNRYIKDVREKLEIVTKIAEEHNKVAALTETGLERIPDPEWWTTVLWPAVKDLKVSYVLVWRNAIDRPDHFFAPFPGQDSEADFIRFYELPGSLFQQDITEKAIYK